MSKEPMPWDLVEKWREQARDSERTRFEDVDACEKAARDSEFDLGIKHADELEAALKRDLQEPVVAERYTDNGEVSHTETIFRACGSTLSVQPPQESSHE